MQCPDRSDKTKLKLRSNDSFNDHQKNLCFTLFREYDYHLVKVLLSGMYIYFVYAKNSLFSFIAI